MPNLIKKVVDTITDRYLIKFKPTKEFYTRVGIRQKAWGKMLKNDMHPDAVQLIALAEFFGVKIHL